MNNNNNNNNMFIDSSVSTTTSNTTVSSSDDTDNNTSNSDDNHTNVNRIMDILSRNFNRINPTEALPLLPDSIPLTSIKSFLVSTLRYNMDHTRMLHTTKALTNYYTATIRADLVNRQARSVIIEKTSLCSICNRKLVIPGKNSPSSLGIYPNGKVVHSTCIHDNNNNTSNIPNTTMNNTNNIGIPMKDTNSSMDINTTTTNPLSNDDLLLATIDFTKDDTLTMEQEIMNNKPVTNSRLNRNKTRTVPKSDNTNNDYDNQSDNTTNMRLVSF